MPDLPPEAHKKFVRLLYRTCGHHEIVPDALKVPAHYDRTSDALYRGGYADVWKGECSGREVAVKVIRLYSTDVLRKVINVGGWWHFVSPPSRLIMLCVEVLQGGCDVEIPSTPKHPTTVRSDDVGNSVCHGIALDGERKHQGVH